MKLAGLKRTMLAGLVALSVAGSSLAPVVAGHASAAGGFRPGGPMCDAPAGPHCNPGLN